MKKNSSFTVGSRSTSRRTLSLVAGLLLLGGAGHTALADSFVLTERAGGKLVCIREEGETFCDVVSAGRFKAVANVKSPFDLATIDGGTTFRLFVGNLNIDVSLSDDPKYVPGKRSAVFVYGHYNDNDKLIVDTKVVLRWSAKGFTATVSGKVNSDQEPILAEQYTGSEGAFTDTQEFSVSFAGLSWENQPIDIAGKATNKIVFRGQGDNREEFEIITVTLKGKLPPTP